MQMKKEWFALTIFGALVLGMLGTWYIEGARWWKWKNQIFECPMDTELEEETVPDVDGYHSMDKIKQFCRDPKTGKVYGHYVIRYQNGEVFEIGSRSRESDDHLRVRMGVTGSGFIVEEPKCASASAAADLQRHLEGGRWHGSDGKRYTSYVLSGSADACPSGEALLMKEENTSLGIPAATSTYCIEEDGFTLGVPEHPGSSIKIGTSRYPY